MAAQHTATSAEAIELEPEHIRAGRALLNWSQIELARRAGIDAHTVASFENGERRPFKGTRQRIRDALTAGGVLLVLDPHHVGVAMQRRCGVRRKR